MIAQTLPSKVSVAAGLGVAAILFVIAAHMPERDDLGRPLPLSMMLGGAFGMVLQRSRFCFFCMSRDFLDRRDPRGLLGILAALAVGLLGTYAVFGAWMPQPSPSRLPAEAHIGPVSWVLVSGALVFGIGMTVSGSCLGAHLYRLGEGSPVAPFALLGAMAGFALGFLSWNTLYLAAIQEAPVVWLPRVLGYAGSLVLQLAVLGVLALLLLRHRAPDRASAPLLMAAVFHGRWPAYVGGVLIGMLATVAYLRVGPLGVTAELGSWSRTAASAFGLLPSRLEGLDGFAGCATATKELFLSRNGVFAAGLVLGSLASALVAGQFQPRWPNGRDAWRGLLGGLLLGWGAMVSLGCTVGVLLSGIFAGAASGWIFAAFCFAGVWASASVARRLSPVLDR